jgi:hypothetical protein
MPVERDLIITAQAFPERVRFHWGNGLEIIDDKELPVVPGSPVVLKNGSPDTPLKLTVVDRTGVVDGVPYFYVINKLEPLNPGGRPSSELVRFSTVRAGIGRYEADGKSYTALVAKTLGREGINRYLTTVDAYPTSRRNP